MIPLLALVLLLTTPVIAQVEKAQPLVRGKALGLVLDKDGKPWAGATVSFLTRQLPFAPGAGFDEALSLVSDGKGRVRVTLVEGAQYVGWAVGPGDDKGLYRRTKVTEQLRAGRRFVLWEGGQNRQLRIRVHMPEGRKFSFRASAWHNGALRQEVLELRDGGFDLPRWPDPGQAVDVLDESGHVLMQKRFLVSQAGREQQGQSANNEVWKLPTFRKVALQCVALEDRKTVLAQARVSVFIGHRWVERGETDTQGRIDLEVVEKHLTIGSKDRPWILVRAAGRAEHGTRLSLDRGSLPPVSGSDADRTKPWQIALIKQPGFSGRILKADGTPAAGRILVIRGQIYESRRSTRDKSYLFRPNRLARTDAEGRFTIPLPGPYPKNNGRVTSVSILIPAADRGPMEVPVPLVQEMPILETLARHAGRVVPLELHLGKCEAVDIEVRQEGGGFALGARGVLRMPAAKDFDNSDHAFPFTIPRRGKLSLLLPPSPVLIGVGAQGGCLIQKYGAPGDEKRKRPLLYNVPETLRVRGVLLDQLEKAIAHADLEWSLMGSDSFPATPAQLLQERFHAYIFDHTATTDEEGRFTLLLPFRKKTYYVGASYRIGPDLWADDLNSTNFEVKEEPIDDLRLKIERRNN